MELWMTIITALIAPLTLGGAAILWKYLEKKSNLKIKALEEKIDNKSKGIKRDYGIIYNILTALLTNLKADRCYIIQPHPLLKHHYISVIFEVDNMGVVPIKNTMTDYEVTKIPKFFGDLSSRDFVAYSDISNMKGSRARANYMSLGTKSLYIKRMNDDDDWVGNLAIDYLDSEPAKLDYARNLMNEAADKIRYILPPVE